MSANSDNIVQSINSVETYAYGTNKEIIPKKRRTKVYQYNKTIQNMINYDYITKEDIFVIYTEY